jgi:hypothetical protein
MPSKLGSILSGPNRHIMAPLGKSLRADKHFKRLLALRWMQKLENRRSYNTVLPKLSSRDFGHFGPGSWNFRQRNDSYCAHWVLYRIIRHNWWQRSPEMSRHHQIWWVKKFILAENASGPASLKQNQYQLCADSEQNTGIKTSESSSGGGSKIEIIRHRHWLT